MCGTSNFSVDIKIVCVKCLISQSNIRSISLKSQVPLLPSLYCPWNDSTNVCSGYHSRNPQHVTHFLNSVVGYIVTLIVRSILKLESVKQREGYKIKILEWERSRNPMKALTIDAVVSHLLLKWTKHLWNGFHSQTTWLKSLLWSFIHTLVIKMRKMG